MYSAAVCAVVNYEIKKIYVTSLCHIISALQGEEKTLLHILFGSHFLR